MIFFKKKLAVLIKFGNDHKTFFSFKSLKKEAFKKLRKKCFMRESEKLILIFPL